MRSGSQQAGQTRPSFIEEARRRQIVDTAIRTIAERGYSATSLVEIARSAGISKGLISYHFAGKGELVEEILSRLMREPAAFIKSRVDAAEGVPGKLRAYVSANFEFMERHRNHYVALVELWHSRGAKSGANRFAAEAYEPSRHYLTRILTGSRTPTPLASIVQAAIDGVMLQWVLDPAAIDLHACRDEIIEMLTRHVARTTNQENKEGTEP